jgi:hypothetical protein
MKRLGLLLAGIFGAGSSSATPPFDEGQVWSYDTRAADRDSTFQINKVETHETLGRIFHISVDQVRVRNPHIEGGISSELPHFPVSEETLKKSAVKLVRDGVEPNSNYLDGYGVWKEAFDRGEAGVFTISIAEIVDLIESSINQSQSAP